MLAGACENLAMSRHARIAIAATALVLTLAACTPAGRWDELAKLGEESVAKEPFNADWWLILGYARSQLGAHDAAAKAYGEALRFEPDNHAAWNLLAQSHRARGDSQRAVIVLNNALL